MPTSAGNSLVDSPTEVKEVSAVDTDVDGQFTVTFGELRQVDSVQDVYAQPSSGSAYVIGPVSVSGNTVTFEVNNAGGGLVTGTADVTDVTAVAHGE